MNVCRCGKKIIDETFLDAPREVAVAGSACVCGSNCQCGEDPCPCGAESSSADTCKCGANCTCNPCQC
ncbi:hypothetical protein KP509_25G073300 [Ceratopteris richardii]|uniref:Metallothionein n=1 Tax=Ceratopteris richardii TaxID=49495 RepID=A0A8T2RRQ7_CERRI|nr:hypothetical protein KP509_25G073300 [Ceratopteris richardii]